MQIKVNQYIDQFGRMHEKQNKKSNNGWIYSAYAIKAGIELNISKKACNDCFTQNERHPFSITTPPISRDEIIGLYYILKPKFVSFDFTPKALSKPKFNLIKFIKQAKELYLNRNNRNFFWQNNLGQIYHIAFKVPLQDRHFILKQTGKYNLFYHLIHLLDQKIPTKNRSELAIKWLKGNRKNSDIIQYFDSNHPIVKHLQNN